MMRVPVHEQLSCEGYFGFGGGWARAHGRVLPNGELICSECPLGQVCWDKHKARVRALFPESTRRFEELVRQCGGDGRRALELYMASSHGVPEPFISVMFGHIEDGSAVAIGGTPKDRGEFTLPWPFPRL